MTKVLSTLALSCFACILIFSGCGPNPFQEKMAEIDSLIIEVEAIGTKLDKVDSVKVNARLNTLLANVNFIEQNSDTISRETAFMIDRYARYKKAYSRWGEKIPAFYEEVALRKSQLLNLKSDMQKELIDSQKANLFYSEENLHIKTLNDIVHRMDSSLNSIESEYLEAEAEVKAYIEEIKSKSDI